MSPVRNFRSLWRSNRSGTAALEFGLLAPLMLTFLIGTVDLGYYMIERMSLNRGVEAGTLYMLKNQTWAGSAPVIGAIQAGGGLPATGLVSQVTATATCFYGCPNAAGTGITTQPGTCGSGSSTPTCAATSLPPGQYVTISASLSTPTLIATTILSLPATSSQTATVRWQ